MKKYIIINEGKFKIFDYVNVFKIPFIWLYCKIKKYELLIYERRDLD